MFYNDRDLKLILIKGKTDTKILTKLNFGKAVLDALITSGMYLIHHTMYKPYCYYAKQNFRLLRRLFKNKALFYEEFLVSNIYHFPYV